MLIQISPKLLRTLASILMLAFSAKTVAAQDSTLATTEPAASATITAGSASASPAAVQLSFGVPDVLKLSQAKVSDDTIVTYVQSSGRSYGALSASEIVYLHEQGVSDRVVSAMLSERKKSTEAAAQIVRQASTTPATTPANAVPNNLQYRQAYASTPVTYVQPAPASTVYVIPNSSRYVDYGYGYYPSYGYYGYSYPGVSLSFGYYGGYRGSYGGYRSGYYYGGGHHGGGSYGGHHGGGSHGGGGGGHHGGGRGGGGHRR